MKNVLNPFVSYLPDCFHDKPGCGCRPIPVVEAMPLSHLMYKNRELAQKIVDFELPEFDLVSQAANAIVDQLPGCYATQAATLDFDQDFDKCVETGLGMIERGVEAVAIAKYTTGDYVLVYSVKKGANAHIVM